MSNFFKTVLLIFALSFTTCNLAVAKDKLKIGMFFFKSGKIYDEAYQGVKDGLNLEKIDYKEIVMNSKRDKSIARKNLTSLDNMNLDLIVAYSSAGTKIAKDLKLKTPIYATVVNHPLALDIKSNIKNENHIDITGTSYFIHAHLQYEFYKEVIGDIKRIGMIYDSNNPAGYLAEMPLMQKELKNRGVSFFKVAVTKKSELKNAAKNLVKKKVEAIIIPTNKVVYSNLNEIIKITTKKKIPVLGMNKQSVEMGALAALYGDTYKLGRQLAKMIIRAIHEKKKNREIPFEYISRPDVIINLGAAKKINFEFSPNIINKATIVLKTD